MSNREIGQSHWRKEDQETKWPHHFKAIYGDIEIIKNYKSYRRKSVCQEQNISRH